MKEEIWAVYWEDGYDSLRGRAASTPFDDIEFFYSLEEAKRSRPWITTNPKDWREVVPGRFFCGEHYIQRIEVK